VLVTLRFLEGAQLGEIVEPPALAPLVYESKATWCCVSMIATVAEEFNNMLVFEFQCDGHFSFHFIIHYNTRGPLGAYWHVALVQKTTAYKAKDEL
jgi:hypothetical protein